MKKLFFKLLLSVPLLFGNTMYSQQFVRVNQIGYLSESPKQATVSSIDASYFEIKDAKTEAMVYRGNVSEGKLWNQSNESIQVIDFSSFKTPGKYFIEVEGERSFPFEIQKDSLFNDVSVWTIKAFYLWRSSIAIEPQYAKFKDDNYARAEGHPDTVVYIHKSAATELRHAESAVSSSKGWYDAGDYNKYVVNAGITLHQLFMAYELFPDYYRLLNLTIPESSDSMPDLLNEIKWELDWLLTMQDPADGGVYHKLTTLSFCDMIQPDKDKKDRYMVSKSTAATLDFAAEMAMASRILKLYDPDYAAKALLAARKAWNWAQKNSNVIFSNPTDVRTGSYRDTELKDEFFWAASELFIATKEKEFYTKLDFFQRFESPTWSSVNSLGLMSLRLHLNELPDFVDKNQIERKFHNLADAVYNQYKYSAGKIAIKKFEWGSNGVIATNGTILGLAYILGKDAKYAQGMVSHLDYLLGSNPTDYCFVTRFGTKYPKHLHDRRCESDGIQEPIPGYLCGGANPNQISDCGRGNYPSIYPARCYLDEICSFSTNEIALNWNSPFVLLVGMVQNIYKQK